MFAILFSFHFLWGGNFGMYQNREQISLTRPTEIAWGLSSWQMNTLSSETLAFFVSWSGGCIIALLIGNDCSMAHLQRKGKLPLQFQFQRFHFSFGTFFLQQKHRKMFWGGARRINAWSWEMMLVFFFQVLLIRNPWSLRILEKVLEDPTVVVVVVVVVKFCGLGWSRKPCNESHGSTWEHPPFSEKYTPKNATKLQPPIKATKNDRGFDAFELSGLLFWDLMSKRISQKSYLQEMHYSNTNCFWEGW